MNKKRIVKTLVKLYIDRRHQRGRTRKLLRLVLPNYVKVTQGHSSFCSPLSHDRQSCKLQRELAFQSVALLLGRRRNKIIRSIHCAKELSLRIRKEIFRFSRRPSQKVLPAALQQCPYRQKSYEVISMVVSMTLRYPALILCRKWMCAFRHRRAGNQTWTVQMPGNIPPNLTLAQRKKFPFR